MPLPFSSLDFRIIKSFMIINPSEMKKEEEEEEKKKEEERRDEKQQRFGIERCISTAILLVPPERRIPASASNCRGH